MPLELGIDLGCRRYGGGEHKAKVYLILDRERHRYQKFISDISGQDISPHNDDPEQAIRVVRRWLRTESNIPKMPGPAKIIERYQQFRQELPALCDELNLDIKDLPFVKLSYLIVEWLKEHQL